MEACAILILAHAHLLVLVREITLELFVEHVLILKIIDIKQNRNNSKYIFPRFILKKVYVI